MKLSLKSRAYNATGARGLQDYAMHEAARAWMAGYRAAKRDARKKRPASHAQPEHVHSFGKPYDLRGDGRIEQCLTCDFIRPYSPTVNPNE